MDVTCTVRSFGAGLPVRARWAMRSVR